MRKVVYLSGAVENNSSSSQGWSIPSYCITMKSVEKMSKNDWGEA